MSPVHPRNQQERVLDAGCGSGRVTAQLCEQLPGGSVIALDRSAAMLIEAKRRLTPFGERVGFVRADLARPLPLHPVDAVFSTATFHWIRDHDALFANLAGVSSDDLVSRSSTTSDSTSWRVEHVTVLARLRAARHRTAQGV